MAKKTVFITGGTGNMGWAAVQEMIKHPRLEALQNSGYKHRCCTEHL